MQEESFDAVWPPEYTLRHSKKAKHYSLKVSPRQGLVVVVPKLGTRREAIAFLNAKKGWVLKQLRAHVTPHDETRSGASFLKELHLAALRERWLVRYRHLNEKIRLTQLGGQLLIAGKFTEFGCCVPLLRNWLRQQAEQRLGQQFYELSDVCGLPYQKLTWRYQSTRWGSCSAHNNISLNVNLLFLEPELVRYVMIHELCHTKQHNHSSRFWQLVEKHCPDYHDCIKALKAAEACVPF